MNSEQDPKKRQQDAAIRAQLSIIKKKYFVMSGKGGVGKSSVAVGLAALLASQGRRVGLMDVDLHGPSVPGMLGIDSRLAAGPDGRLIPQKWGENLSVISIQSMLEGGDEAVIWRGPRKIAAIRQFAADVAWGELDYLFIDSPPGTGDEPLAVARTVPEARAIVVTTPQEVSLRDVRKAIAFLKKVDIEPQGLVENMSGFTCPHCGETTALFGAGGGRVLAEASGLAFLGAIPLDPGAVAAADQGRVHAVQAPDSPMGRALAHIAAGL